jgi:hypothetical protein
MRSLDSPGIHGLLQFLDDFRRNWFAVLDVGEIPDADVGSGGVLGLDEMNPAPKIQDLGAQDSGVVALKIEKTVENPNLERVHAGMPIQIVSKAGAQPGEMLPRIETHAVIYDKEGYPEPEPPKQTDISEETAKTWGVRTWRPPPELRLTAADEALAAVVPISREEELDAISTEEES